MDTLGGTRMYNFHQKFKALKANIRMWNKEEFGNIFEDKRRLIQKLTSSIRKVWNLYGTQR